MPNDNRCAHSESINQHIREQDRIEEAEEKAIQDMRDTLEDQIALLARNFRHFAKDYDLDSIFKDALIQDLKELL